MVLSVESCDSDSCGQWIGGLANLWRTCGDIQGYWGSVMDNVRENNKMAKWAGPHGGPLDGGHWNDADMLQVGNIGLSLTEQKSHYALWALMTGPLLIGTDVSMLTNASLLILGNEEVTARCSVVGRKIALGDAIKFHDCWLEASVSVIR
jgi:alpha-galactosidase